jgi:methylated-DNA-[protein]-cysteine S-methyltransferase
MSAAAAWTIFESPIGPLTLAAGPQGLTNIYFPRRPPQLPAAAQRPLAEAVGQLAAYFAGERRAFELDLDLRGTPLQLAVWRQLLEIPYGETTTYGAVAAAVEESLFPAGLEAYERPRVVGAEIGRNPIPVVVACHRVIGADGSLTGYYGGLERKRALLELEGWSGGGDRSPDRETASDQLALL